MDKLVPIVNKLQNVLSSFISSETLSLPHIAVVGAQSVGKTSLLESLVGLSFMPKGEDIVTRTPIIIQLTNSKSEECYCTLTYTDYENNRVEKHVDDFSILNDMLIDVTEEITGGNKCIKESPIIIEIHKSDVLDLTLIDLPGLTKVPVGNQPQNVEEQIVNLVNKYIKNPNCIILAVSCANIDLANSDSLKMARSVDPKHERTIGVITKCDMVEKPEIWKKMISGSLYPLKKGFVAVVCRSQKEVEDNTTIEDSLRKEEEYFNQCLDLSNQMESIMECGIKNLAKKLNNILIEHIKNTVPFLKPKIDALKSIEEEKLLELGEPMDNMNRSEYLAVLVNYITKFSQQYQDIIDGKVFYKDRVDELKGGARIHYIFNDWYIKSLNDFSPLELLTDEEIRIAIRNSSGPRGALFVPESAFETLIKKLINCLKEPSLRCADQVYEELIKIVDNCRIADMERFTNLKSAINEQVKILLKDCLQPTKEMIKNLMLIELSYINTSHPDFLNEQFMRNVYDKDNDYVEELDHAVHMQSNSNKLPHSKRDFPDGYPPTGSGGSNNCMGSSTVLHPHQHQQHSQYSQHSQHAQHAQHHHPSHHHPPPNHPPYKEDAKLWKGKDDMRPFKSKEGTKITNIHNSRENVFVLPVIPEKIIPEYSSSSKEIIEIDLIKSLINNYFNIVRKHIADAVPKAIMHFMVNTSRKTMQKVLISNLHNSELFNLFNECSSIKVKRNNCKKNLESLNQAIKMLAEIRNQEL
ncbi:dynamin-like protein, putative [Plasmodium vivax]|uniref:Dynamin protein, putative n=6 Tax=Plasmodium vivax TaxID=5855 RepID=A5KDT2_PLAVS|nr:dynamin protein, putative [Plasmodium vivax]KMZ81609.1 dynamin protein [Plasmodium vivax India VII]KMZ87825.1 dynamin protein [Plasmodium vivax Brazil I]KMZ94085.1 dynamin protein [Plasmodium vivax Mauritania I]KNA00635.1 dynamin protein [Plasmodium vivax North Korean]EDL42378.1 dynamin protein, putative [Plasmodium vivax]|eukprot:XP_001608402.1 dynamin protein [Plasmodium vivax Sal-1]